MQSTVDIRTADGVAPAHTFQPASAGRWPAVLFYMDGIGIRPAMFHMAQRLADHGYFVLLPDLYYRHGPYEPVDARAVFSDPESPVRKRIMQMYMSLDNAMAMQDTAAYLAFLQQQPVVLGKRIGCVGYCMGGTFALRAAGTYPDRVAAAASFHGVKLATDAPDSPHLLASQMRAHVYVGVAGTDPQFPPEEGERLAAALTAAGVPHAIETYAGTHHGFAVDDTPAHHGEAAERHWEALLKLFGETLSPSSV
jgi:carboxymethylenebutenolidase